MDKLASRLNKAVTRAGGGINNEIAAKALRELGWTQELTDRIEELETALRFYAEYTPTLSAQDFRSVARAALEGKND